MTEAEWLDSGEPILDLEAERGWPSPRKQRLFAVACCNRLAHLLPDERWRPRLAVAERYADRQAKRTELKASIANARAVCAVGRAGQTYADLLADFLTRAILWACHPTQRTYAGQVATNASCAAAYAALPLDEPYVAPAYSRHHRRWSKAEDAELAAQIALVREVCGDPFHPHTPTLSRIGREVIRLAQAAYEERPSPSGELDRGRLAVLSDALEDAGCADDVTLAHLRSPGPHVRGCWALDLVLGKQ